VQRRQVVRESGRGGARLGQTILASGEIAASCTSPECFLRATLVSSFWWQHGDSQKQMAVFFDELQQTKNDGAQDRTAAGIYISGFSDELLAGGDLCKLVQVGIHDLRVWRLLRKLI
jgi:beta-glucanase (GH16 family)